MKKRLIYASILLISIIVILPLFFKDYLPFFSKNVGTFEYIRKGEALLNEGSYKKALQFFEKAYESSPDNENVKVNLVYAYAEYGKSLAESGNYDSAIEYLTKAYVIYPSSSTITNLALFYEKKAFDEIDKSGLDWAGKYAKKARFIASDWGDAKRALANVFYRDAIDAYKRGKLDASILFLKEALQLKQDASCGEFLGDVYYKKGDLKNAGRSWKEALSLEPQSVSVADKLKKLSKEMALSARLVKRDLTHFDLRFEKKLSLDVERIQRALEDSYLAVGEDLGYYPGSKTVIYIYTHGDFANIFKMPSLVRAFYDGAIRLPLPEGLPGEYEMDRYLRHEYTHAVVSALTNNNCPVWLNEGIATREELKTGDDWFRRTFREVVKDDMLSIGALEKAFKDPAGTGDVRPYYILSCSVVMFIIDQWGLDGLRSILARLGNGQHIVNAIDDEFLIAEHDFENRWIAYVRKNFR